MAKIVFTKSDQEKWNDILQTINSRIVPIGEEGENLIQKGIESGMLKAYPCGEITKNEDGTIKEFKIYEISIGVAR